MPSTRAGMTRTIRRCRVRCRSSLASGGSRPTGSTGPAPSSSPATCPATSPTACPAGSRWWHRPRRRLSHRRPALASGAVTDRRPLLIDGNNGMGAAADGWGRDRAGAARRLLGRVQCYAAATDRAVTIVFDVPFPDLPEGAHDGVTVRYATRRGRDAADDRIVELLAAGP